jgi:hypothetical protein
MKLLLVAGGARSLVYGNLRRKLNQQGWDVGWYASEIDGSRFTGIPTGCEGVILIEDLVSHPFYWSASRTAVARQTALRQDGKDFPVATVPRKWSHAEPILRLHGFFQSTQSVPARDPTDTELYEFLLAYFVKEMARGRLSVSTAEMQDALKKGFQREVRLSEAIIKKARSQAVVHTLVQHGQDRVEAESRLSEADVQSYVEVLAETHPSKLLDPDELLDEIRTHGNVSDPRLVYSAAKSVLDRWKTDLPFRNKCMQGWLAGWFHAVWWTQTTGTSWPTNQIIYQESRRIFGSQPPQDVVIESRVQGIGTWARTLIDKKVAQSRLAVGGYTGSVGIKELLSTGQIRSIDLGQRVITSEEAVDEFLKKWKENPVEPPKEEPPKEEPPKEEPPARPGLATDDILTLAQLLEEQFAVRLGQFEQRVMERFEGLEARLREVENRGVSGQPIRNGLGEILREFRGFNINIDVSPKSSEKQGG